MAREGEQEKEGKGGSEKAEQKNIKINKCARPA